MEDNSHDNSINDASVVLNSLIQNNEQTHEQFNNMFQSINITPEPLPVMENLDGVLNYLQGRETSLLSENSLPYSSDAGIFSFVSSVSQRHQQNQINESIRNSSSQCLDVMMNHLRAREFSLERSPEYSIELNFTNQLTSDGNEFELETISNNIDNRLISTSNNSENCSLSEIPDNDRIALLQHEENRNIEPTNSALDEIADSIEFIELDDNDEHCSSNFSSNSLVDFIAQPVSLKIDNFISDEYVYDSDKDIDESEFCDDKDSNEQSVYIPSFCSHDLMISCSSSETRDNTEETSSKSPVPCNDTLPGECPDSEAPEIMVHTRNVRDSLSNHQITNNVHNVTENRMSIQNDDVEPFVMVDNPEMPLDYSLTDRLVHYK